MAAKLVGTFLRCALGPVNYAGQCIIASRVPDGLRELTPDSLFGGVQLGIGEAAKQVGVKTGDVERLLPMNDIRLSAQRLGFAQKNAEAAWNAHAGQIGGLLAGVAELTVDGRAPDVALCLERLAKKVSRDKPLSEPLHALADEVERWIELVETCGSRLEDGGVLARAYRRRRIQQIAAGAVLAVALTGSLVAVLWVRAGRARVEDALASADPCVAAALPDGDRARGSLDQKKRVEERVKACEDKRAAEERAREEQRVKDERAKEEARQRQDRVDRCEALAAHVAAGSLDASDDAVADGRAPLLGRIAKASLDPADFGPENPTLPCAGTPGGDKLAAAFDRAVLAIPTRWASAENPSDRVRATLEQHVSELPSVSKQVLASHADDAAKRALVAGGVAQTAKAVRLCKLKDALGIRGGKYCSSVLAMK